MEDPFPIVVLHTPLFVVPAYRTLGWLVLTCNDVMNKFPNPSFIAFQEEPSSFETYTPIPLVPM